MERPNSIWHQPPTRVYCDGNKSQPTHPHAVRYTWAGPFNTQLYDDQLQALSQQTTQNLGRLAGAMMEQTAAQLPASHQQRSRSARPHSAQAAPRRAERPTSSGSWTNLSVMFGDGSGLGDRSRAADDTTSLASASASSRATNFCYLCSTMEEHMRSHHLKTRVQVPVNKDGSVRQRKQRVRYTAPPPRLKRREEEAMPVQEALYKVTVWTGDLPGAGTDACVYITIVGDQGMLPRTRLWRRQGTTNFCFVRGSKEVLYLKGPKLGNLAMLSIEHDGMEKRHGWYVDRLEVQCMRSLRVWLFVCKNWLSLHHGDFLLTRDLEALEKEPVMKGKPSVFEVTVETGRKRLAGTDANVYITLHGTRGRSAKHHLNAQHRGEHFQKGQVDKFKIRVPDIGEIRSMRIEHDGQGMASGWFLSKVTLQDVNQPQVIYHFLYNGWLAKDVGDGQLWRELRAKKRLPKEVTSGKPVQYEVVVKTGDVRYAGTDANVYVIFVGSKGKSSKMFMDDISNNFERGMTESFKLKASNVGSVKSIILGHDNSGPGAGWFCEHVKVRKYLTRQEISEQLSQQKTAWRGKRRQQRRRLSERLKREDKENEEEGEDEEEEGKGGVKRDERFADVFDRDGRVVKVPVYEEYFFAVSQWFAADEGDGLLERELEVQTQTLFFQDRS